MSTVTIIPATTNNTNVLRVAAYCRVSSNSADQLHSYSAQIKSYTNIIESHADWKLVDIYADLGITGTSLLVRNDFQRMMTDCENGKIDLILVKSISRFSRNTMDCLTSLRRLSALGVAVQFEKENIDTKTLTTEMMVSVFSAIAQQESISISENQKLSYKRRMKNGDFITTFAPYGYRLSNKKDLEIEPQEAHIVRNIYEAYLSGHSLDAIAALLTDANIMSPAGTAWNHTTLRRILSNEKYIGDTLCQKTYNTSIPFQKKKNQGELPQYYVKNTHPAIIPVTTFQQVQRVLNRRSFQSPRQPYPLTGKLFCAHCGSVMGRKVLRSGTVTWVCRRHNRKASSCLGRRITEKTIYNAFQQMYRKLHLCEEHILIPIMNQLHTYETTQLAHQPERIKIHSEIARLSEENHKISQWISVGLIDEAACAQKKVEISTKITQLQKQLQQSSDLILCKKTISKLQQVIQAIHDGPTDYETFDLELFQKLVDHLSIDNTGTICFHLHGGIVFTEYKEGKNDLS